MSNPERIARIEERLNGRGTDPFLDDIAFLVSALRESQERERRIRAWRDNWTLQDGDMARELNSILEPDQP